ncbi:MAG: hypothetical protein MJY98_09060 [Fibrobacter sp.]|nr:hypothetical protein [Fibrobacter sp.]
MGEKNIFGEEEEKVTSYPLLKRVIIILVVGFVLLWVMLLYFDSVGAPPVDFFASEPTSNQVAASPEKVCKNSYGQPYDWACRKALRSKGYNVDKYISWGGADNGMNSAVCTATESSGIVVGFEIIFKEKCEALSVKNLDY